MKSYLLILIVFITFSCKKTDSNKEATKKSTADTSAISTKDFREFKVLDSKYLNNDELWSPFNKDLEDFTEEAYNSLKPLILEQDIPTIQEYISDEKLSYENLTKFYLYRIRKFDRENPLSLNAVIALNPNVITQAKQKDKELLNKRLKHPIFGMPILLKDNINASGMPTTAGAVALLNNLAEDAFIVKQLRLHGALILGKANLSEWAYFFCGDCPSGYSAIGGQTLNPYGRRIIDTGGSSSGSGVAVSANFCVAAVGSETSGSILSPASQNSVVGFKPTVGLLSRSGIVPISSTLDTPGPITKNVVDNAIMLDAMFGFDNTDTASIEFDRDEDYYENLINTKSDALSRKRFGVFKEYLKDSLFANAIQILRNEGASIIEIEEDQVEINGFLTLLNIDMKNDLPNYLNNYGSKNIVISSVADVISFNKKDSLNRMPYGQKLFYGIVNDKTTKAQLQQIKDSLHINGKYFFDVHLKTHNLDAIISINNYNANEAAVAEYPALTVPMGYSEDGAPKGLTFIAKSLQENLLLKWAYAYEQASKMRQAPKDYN
ncbi:MAG: amidase [Flavobacteriaceae bacterium]|nr:amidase [Flavobacteriaceae bacterium]